MKTLPFDGLVRSVRLDVLEHGHRDVPLVVVRQAVASLVAKMRAALRRGERVHLPGLLTMAVRTRKARAITNFSGARVVLPESRELHARATRRALR